VVTALRERDGDVDRGARRAPSLGISQRFHASANGGREQVADRSAVAFPRETRRQVSYRNVPPNVANARVLLSATDRREPVDKKHQTQNETADRSAPQHVGRLKRQRRRASSNAVARSRQTTATEVRGE